MKTYKIFNLFFGVVLVLTLITGCEFDEQWDIKDGGTYGAIMTPEKAVPFLYQETTEVTVNLNAFANEGVSISEINIVKQLFTSEGNSDPVIGSTTGDQITQTESELFADVPVNGNVLTEDDLIPGDYWLLSYKMTLADGRIMNIGDKTTIAFTCPSALVGNYATSTTWIDYYGTPGGNNWTETYAPTSVPGQYSLTDLSGGMEPIVWGGDPVPAVVEDICGVITLVEATYRYAYYIEEGYINPDGSIFIKWINAYGENGENTYVAE